MRGERRQAEAGRRVGGERTQSRSALGVWGGRAEKDEAVLGGEQSQRWRVGLLLVSRPVAPVFVLLASAASFLKASAASAASVTRAVWFRVHDTTPLSQGNAPVFKAAFSFS